MLRPLKVLVVMGPIAQGGAEWQLYELLRRLDRTRFEPVLVSIISSRYEELVIDDGDRTIRNAFASLDIPSYTVEGYNRNDLRTAREVLRVIRRERPDVVHTNLYAGELWGRVAAILARKPIVTHKRGMPYKTRKPQNVLVDWLLNLCSERIIVVNRAIQCELQRLQWLPSRKFTVVYPGLDSSLWLRADEAELCELRTQLGLENAQVISCVGRLRPIKGQRYLIDAMPSILRECPNTRLLLIGHGASEQALRERVRELGLERDVLFLGSRADVRELLSISTVLVMPSVSEASPVALMEGALVGVPSVATRVGGIPEIVQDRVTGVLVPPRRVRPLVSAVVALLRDTETRARMSTSATECGRSRFDIARTVQQIEAEYCAAATVPC